MGRNSTVTDYDARSALIVVDVQNDFADPAGTLYVSGADTLAAPLNREIRRAREAGSLVVLTQDWHPEHTPHFARDGGVWPVHCVAGSWGAELVPALDAAGERIRKGTGGEDGYSAFSVRPPAGGARQSTGLDELLRGRGIERVVIAGLATDYCVKETALDGLHLGFAVEVRGDLIGAVNLNPGDGARALAEIEAAGAKVT
jgi:nicotinamidase/pyrazinamidase